MLKIIFLCILVSCVNASTFCVACRDFSGPYAGVDENEPDSIKLSEILDIYEKPYLSPTSVVIANTTELFNTIDGKNIQLTIFKIDYNIAYHNPTLYQFDGQGYGNQGYPHNYYFTCELFGEGTAKSSDKLYVGAVDESWGYINGQKVIENPKTGLDLSGKTYNIPNNGYVYIKMFMTQRNYNASELHFETNLINIITIDDCVSYIQNRTFFYANQTTPTPSPNATTPSSNTTTPTPSFNTTTPTPSPNGTTPSSNTTTPTPSFNTTTPSSNTTTPSSNTTTPMTPTVVSSNVTFNNITDGTYQEYGIVHTVLFGIFMVIIAIGITLVLYFLYRQKKKRAERKKSSGEPPVKLHGFLIE